MGTSLTPLFLGTSAPARLRKGSIKCGRMDLFFPRTTTTDLFLYTIAWQQNPSKTTWCSPSPCYILITKISSSVSFIITSTPISAGCDMAISFGSLKALHIPRETDKWRARLAIRLAVGVFYCGIARLAKGSSTLETKVTTFVWGRFNSNLNYARERLVTASRG